MEIRVELLTLDEKDPRTGLIFPSEVMTEAVEEFDKRIRDNAEAIPGEWCPPADTNFIEYLDMAKVSHIVKWCSIEGNRVVAKLHLLKHYAELYDLGVHFSGVLRPVVSLDKQGVVTKCKIITVDLLYRMKTDDGTGVHD